MSIVELKGISKYFPIENSPFFTPALLEIDLTIKKNQFITIIGPSGSGKSTILNIIAGIIRPSTGEIIVSGHNLNKLPRFELQNIRRDLIGYLKQNPWENLVKGLTVLENIELAIELKGIEYNQCWIDDILLELEIIDLRDSIIDYLSGGELYRVGIAVAISLKPDLLILDEPTGELDDETANKILNKIHMLVETHNITIIAATHDPLVETYADGSYRIMDGRIAGFRYNKTLKLKNNDWDEFAVIGKMGTIKIPDSILRKYHKSSLLKFVYDNEKNRYYLRFSEGLL